LPRDVVRTELCEEEALRQKRMSDEEVVGRLVRFVVGAQQPALELTPSGGGDVKDVALSPALAALDALAKQALVLHPPQQRIQHSVVHASLARQCRGQLALQLVAVHRL